MLAEPELAPAPDCPAADDCPPPDVIMELFTDLLLGLDPVNLLGDLVGRVGRPILPGLGNQFWKLELVDNLHRKSEIHKSFKRVWVSLVAPPLRK